MGHAMDMVTNWLQQHAGKVILLLIVMAVAVVATKVVARITEEVLDRANVPNASIFVNILRVVIWAAAIAIMGKSHPQIRLNCHSLHTFESVRLNVSLSTPSPGNIPNTPVKAGCSNVYFVHISGIPSYVT